MNKRRHLFAVMGFLCSTIVGCATSQQTTIRSLVNSIADREATPKKYYALFPGNQGITKDDLQFREYSSFLENAMQYGGFVRTDDPELSEIAVFLSYGIGDPTTHEYTYLIPTWGQTGVASSQSYGTVSSYGGVGMYSGRTTYTPQYGITGATQGRGTYTVYTRYIVADAYDVETYKREKRMLQSWRTTITSTGYSSDLRRVFPYMLEASKRYFGTNTPQAIEILVEEKPHLIKDIK